MKTVSSSVSAQACVLGLESSSGRQPSLDESMGISWWNLMTKAERSAVMGAAEVILGRAASVADVWRLWRSGRVSMRWEDVAA